MFSKAYFKLKLHDGIPVIEIPPSLEELPADEIEARLKAETGKSLEEHGAIGYIVIRRGSSVDRCRSRRRYGWRNGRCV